MKKIEYSGNKGKGKFFTVSDESYDEVKKYKWTLGWNEYAVSKVNKVVVRLHRFLVNCPKGKQVDHKDGDKSNYQLGNLRVATRAENQHNRKKQLSSSKYKGVTWNKKKQRWVAQIRCNNEGMFIGQFKKELDAARAYNELAKKYFGEFARLNPV